MGKTKEEKLRELQRDRITNGGSPVRFDSNIQRNDPCFCKSGLKYKKCCIYKRDRDTTLVDNETVKGKINMTKAEAIKALMKGFKVRHENFSDNEFVYIKSELLFSSKQVEIMLTDEEGIDLDFKDFFNSRTGKDWDINWKLYDDFLKEGKL